MNRVIGIAGGSGSGKSTLAVALCRKHPDRFALLHLDDYFRRRSEVPLLSGVTNWEHPLAIRFDRLRDDVEALRSGASVRVVTKSELYHPAYDHGLRNVIEHDVEPKPDILVEGYLALHDDALRELMDLAIYLDIPAEASIRRRSSNKLVPDEYYVREVLLPMHERYVAPTKRYADLVIDVSRISAEEVMARAEERLGL